MRMKIKYMSLPASLIHHEQSLLHGHIVGVQYAAQLALLGFYEKFGIDGLMACQFAHVG